MININNVVLMGRITKDPELRKTQSNTSVVQFTVAVNRKFKPEGQEKADADFISCVAWRASADFLCRYGHKGDMISVEGRLQTRNYDDQDGKKVYVTEVVADSVQLINKESKPGLSDQDAPPQYKAQNQAEYMSENSSNFGGYASESAGDLDISSDDLPFY